MSEPRSYSRDTPLASRRGASFDGKLSVLMSHFGTALAWIILSSFVPLTSPVFHFLFFFSFFVFKLKRDIFQWDFLFLMSRNGHCSYR